MLALSLVGRVHVVVALIIGAVGGGAFDGMAWDWKAHGFGGFRVV